MHGMPGIKPMLKIRSVTVYSVRLCTQCMLVPAHCHFASGRSLLAGWPTFPPVRRVEVEVLTHSVGVKSSSETRSLPLCRVGSRAMHQSLTSACKQAQLPQRPVIRTLGPSMASQTPVLLRQRWRLADHAR